MAKNKKKAANTALSLRSWRRKHKVLFILAILLVIFGGFWVKKQVDISSERKDFQTAERVVGDLVNQIQNELGKTEVEESKGCGYASAKFGKGRLGCSFSYSFTYNVKNSKEAEENAKIINDIIKNNVYVDLGKSSFPEINGKFVERDTSFADDRKILNNVSIPHLFKGTNSLVCISNVSYGYKQKTLGVYVDCHSKETAKTNYYPIKN